MNRREALVQVAWIVGGAVVGGGLFLEGCSRQATKTIVGLFDASSVAFLGAIADTILPPTDSPGAKEAGVGEFIPVMVRDCYTLEQQQLFVEGIDKLNETAKRQFGRKFQELKADERNGLIDRIDKEAKAYQQNKNADEPDHYFYLFKQLTLLGFFTSELGATKALRYVQIPGRYDGEYPYKKGDKAWAI